MANIFATVKLQCHMRIRRILKELSCKPLDATLEVGHLAGIKKKKKLNFIYISVIVLKRL
jgi:hypothetical protein